MLDEALKNVRVSPSLVFKEADTDGDGVIQLQELEKILKRLGIAIDPLTLDRTFKEIDINGNGQIDQ